MPDGVKVFMEEEGIDVPQEIIKAQEQNLDVSPEEKEKKQALFEEIKQNYRVHKYQEYLKKKSETGLMI